jgi:hypothetical protein
MGFRVWVECSKYASHMTGTADGRGGLIPLVPKDLADATWDGQKKALTPYHGYFFRILEGQGPHAPGGAHSFRVINKLMGGFGLVARPAQYGVRGILTFIVNQDGEIYQKDTSLYPAARQFRSHATIPTRLGNPQIKAFG